MNSLRQIIFQSRLYVAEMLMGWAYKLMPSESVEKVHLAMLLVRWPRIINEGRKQS